MTREFRWNPGTPEPPEPGKMNIAVCIKLVPDTTADIRVAPDGQALQLANVEWVINPYDEYALEAALPPATSREVARWIQTCASASLQVRARLVADVESIHGLESNQQAAERLVIPPGRSG